MGYLLGLKRTSITFSIVFDNHAFFISVLVEEEEETTTSKQ
jgi:hypothetical protein